MIRIPDCLLSLTSVITVAIAGSAALAQDCAPAGTTVRIQATAAGTDTITTNYTVVNHSRESLRWIRIGAGDQEYTPAVNEQTPTMTETPAGWRGIVVYPEETAYIHLWWQVTDLEAAIKPGHSISGFTVRARGPNSVRPGQVGPYGPIQPIDFTTLPFTAGGSHGSRWCGRVTRAP